MRLAAVLIIVLLVSCGCVDLPQHEPGATTAEPATSAATVEDSPAASVQPTFALTAAQAESAASTFREALADERYTADALDLIAKLPVESAMLFRPEVAELVHQDGDLLRLAAAAGLAAGVEQARDFVADGLARRNPQAFMALIDNPEAGRELISDWPYMSEPKIANLYLDLLRSWGGAVASDEPVLRRLLECSDPDVKYRAAGHLLAIGAGGDIERELLATAVKDRLEGWVGAIEGIKISRDPALASALVGLASRATMQQESTEDDDSRGPRRNHEAEEEAEEFQERGDVILASYALSYLPGDQASLMRNRLLGAQSADVRWQALLGELMYGNPQPWHNAVTQAGLEQEPMWIVLTPPEAWNSELLYLYAACSFSDNVNLRQRAAMQMNRYNVVASDSIVLRTMSRLVQDEDPAVRSIAWISAGDLRLSALAREAAGAEQAGLELTERLARAYCALAGGTVPPGMGGPVEKGSDG